MARAPRHAGAALRRLFRGAWLGLLLWPATYGASAQSAPAVLKAAYAEPTTRYDHGVLGDAEEWGALRLRLGDCDGCAGAREVVIRLPESRVFEDTAPRIVTLPGQGAVAVMVVESDLRQGARLALYTADGLLAATPFIGQPHRWLAPVGAADLDGDGALEIAYVDRPHLARTLRVWRLTAETLRPLDTLEGVTNHRIGWDYIEGGLRDCGSGPEMILASADWRAVMAVRFDGTLQSRSLGPYSPEAIQRAMSCR